MSLQEISKKYCEIAQGALPFAAGAIAVARKDWKGTAWLAVAAVVSKIVIDTSKEWFSSKNRPSEPTVFAFLGAGFLVARYGMALTHEYVVTGLALAALVGVARIYTALETWRNVVGGALVGVIAAVVVPHSILGWSTGACRVRF